MDYITAQTPDKGVQIGPEPPISNDSMALTPDKGVQIGPELLITNASTALTPDKGVQIGPEPPISNGSIAMAPDKGVQVGPEPAISNDSIAMTSDTIPGFAGNFIEAGIVLNGTKSAVYQSTAYPADADGAQRPGAVVEYSSEFSVGEGFSMGGVTNVELPKLAFVGLRSGITTDYVIEEANVSQNVQIGFRLESRVAGKWLSLFGWYLDERWLKRVSLTGTDYSPEDNTFEAGWRCGAANSGALSTIAELGKYYNVDWVNNNIKINGENYSAVKIGNYYKVVNSKIFLSTSTCQISCYFARWTYNGETALDLEPRLTAQGLPCLYDKVAGKEYKKDDMVAGFTLEEARNLRKLPTTGGTLTISLPEGYDLDASIMSALETARSKGWTLTIQTYTLETASEGASTFALRRIWIRKTQDENGGYVDADEKRWQVDWCVDMITPDGSTPDAYGYEMFRSVESATEYWGLTPWADPEQKEEFSQEL